MNIYTQKLTKIIINKYEINLVKYECNCGYYFNYAYCIHIATACVIEERNIPGIADVVTLKYKIKRGRKERNQIIPATNEIIATQFSTDEVAINTHEIDEFGSEHEQVIVVTQKRGRPPKQPPALVVEETQQVAVKRKRGRQPKQMSVMVGEQTQPSQPAPNKKNKISFTQSSRIMTRNRKK
mgnify:CR=1 FL=1